MAIVKDLVGKDKTEFPVISGMWYGRIADPVPPDLIHFMYVIIPDISPDIKFGPCRWNRSETPGLDKECLVLFDNRQNPWVITIW